MKAWRCVHGARWTDEKPYFCVWCFIGLHERRQTIFEVVATADEVAGEIAELREQRDKLRAQLKEHVEWWIALGKVLDHYWDTGPMPERLIEDVRQIAEVAHAKGRLAERAAIVADIRASALALDKISDLYPIPLAIRPVIKEVLLSVAEHYATGKHQATSGEPTR